MPNYRKSRGKFVKKHRNFKHPYQMIHFLSTTREKEYKPFRDIAKQYLSGDIVPSTKLSKQAIQHIAYNDPKQLVPHVVHEFEGQLGGGISSGVASIVHEGAHLLGIDLLHDAIFGVTKPQKLQSFDSKFTAYLIAQTYKPISERKDETLGRFTRLSKYDKNNVSVWKNNDTGELTVTVRGTKANLHDIGADIEIFFGRTHMTNDNLDEVLSAVERDHPGEKYNIAGHSLGSAYVWGEQDRSDNWDNVYLFNAPSSPLQSDSAVSANANNEQYNYYLNHGDIASHNLAYFMDHDMLQNNVNWGHYQWSPLSAHSIHNWYPSDFNDVDEHLANQPKTYDNEPTSMDTAEFHQDTPVTQAANLS